jgi:hypothetical protein
VQRSLLKSNLDGTGQRLAATPSQFQWQSGDKLAVLTGLSEDADNYHCGAELRDLHLHGRLRDGVVDILAPALGRGNAGFDNDLRFGHTTIPS